MIYVLAMVLNIGAHEAIIKPIQIYNFEGFSYPMCVMDRDDLQKLYNIPMTCYALEKEI